MSQTREKWDSLVQTRGDFLMIRRCRSIPCFHFHFLFRNDGIREQLDQNDYVAVLVFIFRKCHSQVLLKVLSQQLQDTLTRGFERHSPVEDFIDMDQQRCRKCTKTFDLLLCASLSLKQA